MNIFGTEFETPVLPLSGLKLGGIDYSGTNNYYIKRDDLIPFSFGGNKVRMALEYFADAERHGAGSIITYGGSSSNMCRVIANMASMRGIPCYIVTPDEFCERTFNSRLSGNLLKAEIVKTDVIHSFGTIKHLTEDLKARGLNPYFIESGGHGVIGTGACLGCYEEICSYEKRNGIRFDYIFITAGTGTTQSGLILGQLLNGDSRRIIGISAAQKNPRCRNIVIRSVADALNARGIGVETERIANLTDLSDGYIGEGYGKPDIQTEKIIDEVFASQGIPLDSVYTGKGFRGMLGETVARNICDCNILFVHTGGTPLFFDHIEGSIC